MVNPFAEAIRGYQRYVWLPGSVYGLILLIGLFGIARHWRQSHPAALVRAAGPDKIAVSAIRPGRADIGGLGSPPQAILPWPCSLALIVAPAATAEFDYRYVTTAVPFACLAAAMAFGTAGLARRGAGGGPDGRLADTGHDQRNLTADAT